MAKIKAASLSSDSWIDRSFTTVDTALSWIFLSDYNQTSLYRGHICSVAYLIQKNQGDINGLLADMRSSLETYFSKYLDQVQVEVDNITNVNRDSNITLRIYIVGNDENGKPISVGKTLTTDGTKILKITNLLNNGSLT